MRLVGYGIFGTIGALPILWLGALSLRYETRGTEWWWLATALGVSWIADTVALFAHVPDQVGAVYPILQTGLIALVLLDRFWATNAIGLMLFTALVNVAWLGPRGDEWLLNTVSSAIACATVLLRWELGLLRSALLVLFGIGAIFWLWYVADPFGPGYWLYQGTRLTATLMFCRAAWKPAPSLRWIPEGGTGV